MKEKSNVPSEILNAATAVLSPYIPGLSATVLMKALETYNENKETATPKQSSCPEKPYTRQQASDLLGVSLPTIDRYMAVMKKSSGCPNFFVVFFGFYLLDEMFYNS